MPQRHTYSENLYSLFYSVRRQLSEVTAGFWTDLEVYRALNNAQLHIARKSKCLRKEINITTVASQAEYDLKTQAVNPNSTVFGYPEVFDISADGAYFYVGGTTYQKLYFKSKKTLNIEFPGWQGVAASVPKYFYYEKTDNIVGLYPKPNSTNAGSYLFLDTYYLPKVLHAGTAASGTDTTMVMAAGSTTAMYPSALNDYYNNIFLEIYEATGAGERAQITDYVASSRTLTVDFTTTPDSTSVFGMVPEIAEEAHQLMELYALWKLWGKGGSRKTLANDFRSEYFQGLTEFAGDYMEEDDEDIIQESYR